MPSLFAVAAVGKERVYPGSSDGTCFLMFVPVGNSVEAAVGFGLAGRKWA